MTKKISLLILIILTLVIHSCDDEFVDIYETSRLEKFDSHHLSIFRIPHILSTATIDSDVDIIQTNGSYVGRLHANISPINEFESEVELTIPISPKGAMKA